MNEYIWGALIFKNSILFSQSSANHTPIKRFIVLSNVESTNNYAMAKLHAGMLDSGFCLFTHEQTAGKGQRGKSWSSNPGENITMSTVFPPSVSVPANVAAFPFLLSASMALACYDFIKDFPVSGISIKWPNDIYLGDRKAGGILIENVYMGSVWQWAVVGTGININQVDFPSAAGNAVSLKSITGDTYNVIALGRKLQVLLISRFDQLKSTSADQILGEYNANLYRKGQQIKIRKANAVLTATVERVSRTGELITRSGVERRFMPGEIEFVS